jgi:hypothetical protein
MLKIRLMLVLSMSTAAVVPQALAGEHVIEAQAVAARLSEQQAQRASDLAAVQQVLATPQAADAMRTLGASPADVRAGVATLSASELQDLAARARTLQVDPVAGLSSDVNTLLVVFLIVAIVILVITAVD